LRRQLDSMQRPRHVGVVLDGNRRWAKEAGLEAAHGHQAGARKITELLGWCREARVEVVTLWLLSTNNLNRSSEELQALLEIIVSVVEELTAPSMPWRVQTVGALDLLPEETAERLAAATERTKGRS